MGNAKIDFKIPGIIRYFDDIEKCLTWGLDKSGTIFHGAFRCRQGGKNKYEWGPEVRDMKCVACGEEIPPGVMLLLKMESATI